MQHYMLLIIFNLAIFALPLANAQVSVSSLVNCPVLLPTTQLDIFFPDEKPPERPYTKLLVFEHSSGDNYTAALTAIRKTALKEGMDGVLFQPALTITPDGYNAYLKLVGIGFKYDRNLEEPILVEKRYSVFDTLKAGFVDAGYYRFRFDGKPAEIDVKGFIWEFPEKFSRKWLNAPKGENGKEKLKDGKVVKRTYNALVEYGLVCEYEYTSGGYIQSIRFERLSNWSGRVDFNYNDLGQEIERRISNSPYGPVAIRTRYHADGRIAKLQVQALKKDGEVPIAEVTYIYEPLSGILAGRF